MTSEEPVVLQFMNGRKRVGPIGMSEEKDAAELAAEAEDGGSAAELPSIEPQLLPTWPLVRPSMSSPHGSHAFLRDASRRDSIPFGSSFGENGLEPSSEPPARSMSVEDFREQMGRGGSPARPNDDADTDATQAIARPAPRDVPRPGAGRHRPRGRFRTRPGRSFPGRQPIGSRAPAVALGAPATQAARFSPAPPPVAARPTPAPPHAGRPPAAGTRWPLAADPLPAPHGNGQPPSAEDTGGRKRVLAGWRGRRGDRE